MWDKACNYFDSAIKKIENANNKDGYQFDFDNFLNILKSEQHEDVIKFFAIQILRQINTPYNSEDILNHLQEIAADINGYLNEFACLIHKDPTGTTIKGELPDNMKLVIEARK